MYSKCAVAEVVLPWCSRASQTCDSREASQDAAGLPSRESWDIPGEVKRSDLSLPVAAQLIWRDHCRKRCTAVTVWLCMLCTF
ncbi:hypothetical protein PBY51_004704 [Eleginops maclovinus]|uniref:Uncharacterized protein n=1 Tax=Eleginops maclovinus TaxID=56733 RepID=A0AAN8AGV0_ELEMC|nr:hypothetical protein PBY51_004704 [Eleginops maclovinus]